MDLCLALLYLFCHMFYLLLDFLLIGFKFGEIFLFPSPSWFSSLSILDLLFFIPANDRFILVLQAERSSPHFFLDLFLFLSHVFIPVDFLLLSLITFHILIFLVWWAGMIEIGVDNMIVVEVIIEILLESISHFRIIEKYLISGVHTGRLKIIIFYSRTKNSRNMQQGKEIESRSMELLYFIIVYRGFIDK